MPRLPNKGQYRVSLPWVMTLLIALALPGVSTNAFATQHVPIIAVAASMAGATESIATQFYRASKLKVRISSGASGNLARQILRGAPFELFISADTSYPQRIVDAGQGSGVPTTYATGQLALVLSNQSHAPAFLEPSATSSNEGQVRDAIVQTLKQPHIQHIAMANPEHAPYGRAARESLEFLELWPTIKTRIVMGENVAQSARFALTDAVQAALLPLGIITHSPLADRPYRIIPAMWHAPLRQQMLLIKGASPQAQQFFEFMLGAAARVILSEYGLIPAVRERSARTKVTPGAKR
jgi:molybdate transport system substrate-binding protein